VYDVVGIEQQRLGQVVRLRVEKHQTVPPNVQRVNTLVYPGYHAHELSHGDDEGDGVTQVLTLDTFSDEPDEEHDKGLEEEEAAANDTHFPEVIRELGASHHDGSCENHDKRVREHSFHVDFGKLDTLLSSKVFFWHSKGQGIIEFRFRTFLAHLII